MIIWNHTVPLPLPQLHLAHFDLHVAAIVASLGDMSASLGCRLCDDQPESNPSVIPAGQPASCCFVWLQLPAVLGKLLAEA
jgi:hypothetical protein